MPRSYGVDHVPDGGFGFFKLTVRESHALQNHLYVRDAAQDGSGLKIYFRRAQYLERSVGVNTPYPVTLKELLYGRYPDSPRFGGSRSHLPQFDGPVQDGIAWG